MGIHYLNLLINLYQHIDQKLFDLPKAYILVVGPTLPELLPKLLPLFYGLEI